MNSHRESQRPSIKNGAGVPTRHSNSALLTLMAVPAPRIYLGRIGTAFPLLQADSGREKPLINDRTTQGALKVLA